MKKAIISIAIVALVVSGYFVGNATLDASSQKNEETAQSNFARSPGNNSYVQEKGTSHPSTTIVNSARSVDTGCDGCFAKPAVVQDDIGCDVDACGVVLPILDPSVGNPLGTKIIKTGTVEITIDRNSVTKKYDAVVALIPEGGYIEASESASRESTVVVRIPADKLDETLVALRKLGTITKESITSQDRTYDAIDYDARLSVLTEQETALREQIKNEKDSYEIQYLQDRLFSVRTQIETLNGQKNLLNDQVALSTLTISLTEKGVKQEEPGEKTVLGRAWTNAAGSLLLVIGGMLVVSAAIFPFLVVVIVAAGFLRVIVRRRSRQSSENEALVEQEASTDEEEK